MKLIVSMKPMVFAKNHSLNVVAEEEIEKLLKTLNVHKSTGCDRISARFLKDGASVIACPVTYIINLSMSKSEVLNDFKLARVPLVK